MKNLIVLIALLTFAGLFSQGKGSITGNIVDLEMNNEPLLLAEVSLKGTAIKTRTNLMGNFEIIDITPGNYTLVVGFLGYDTVEIPVQVTISNITVINKGLGVRSISLADIAELVTKDSAFGRPIAGSDGDKP